MPQGPDRRASGWVFAAAGAGAALWNAPLIGLASEPGVGWFGLPPLYLYVFAVWGLVVALFAWGVRRRRPPSPPPSPPPPGR